ncbi:DUF4942 domain-containing protein [Cysteiniphilum marinum]|uniref:DUF4942 domain-containing protein n=1 Tax=Cysteiniphilum marinum TaxID=2774191 RepID=UPI001939ABAF|nr:DUF4942 domain-containing protein [Cysteiniphilum marinum]
MFNKDFYPTPENLAHKMLDKVDFNDYKIKMILEPSAGKGDLIKAFESYRKTGYHSYYFKENCEIHAIEIEPELQAILKDDDIAVIDSDFLAYSGTIHYDLILANFPFSDGDKHLHKAINMMFCGQIVCLLNAETIKNPYSNNRKDLVRKLGNLNAEIEYIENAFIDAERKTGVEIALIYINIERDVETDIFGDLKDEVPEEIINVEYEQNEVATKNKYADLVAAYNRTRDQVTEHLLTFYRNYKNVSGYMSLSVWESEYRQFTPKEYKNNNMTELMQKQQNIFIKKLKRDYWEKITKLPEVEKYLTSGQVYSLNNNIKTFYCKEFTESNIRQFVLNIVQTFPQHINDAIESLFDKMTENALRDNRWGENEYKANIHYFNAWKSNSGYKVNKKVIIPFRYDTDYRGVYRISSYEESFLDDLEKVMTYFQPRNEYEAAKEICKYAVYSGQNRKIDTEYFYISIFKKGTIHIEFKDMELLRRFNIEACKLKNFLPMEYANTAYNELDEESKQIVNAFESQKDYKPISNNVRVLQNQNILMLEKLA